MVTLAKSFLRSIAQRWWWLVTGIVGGGQAVSSLVGITPQIPWFVGVSVFLVCLLIASFLAYCDLFVALQLQKEGGNRKSIVLTRPKKRLGADHNIALWEITQRMETIHGHSDIEGMRADLKDGVLLSDIMNGNCSRCFKPRNEQGDIVL